MRGEVLLELKKSQPLTAKELGDAFGVSANAVRRHLKELEAEGLVSYGREQRGNGAPTYAYRLSPNGEQLFPNRYEEALTRLLRHVVDKEGRDAAVSVLEEQYRDLRRQLGSLDHLSALQRVERVADVMSQAGFMTEYEGDEREVRLAVNNCAIRAAASCLPEVCDTELDFLRDVLEVPLTRETHIMNGCNACMYHVRVDPSV